MGTNTPFIAVKGQGIEEVMNDEMKELSLVEDKDVLDLSSKIRHFYTHNVAFEFNPHLKIENTIRNYILKLKIFSNIKRRYREYLLLASDRKVMQNNPNALLNAFIAQKAIFVHIPKTAGISLVKTIYGDNIERGGIESLRIYLN